MTKIKKVKSKGISIQSRETLTFYLLTFPAIIMFFFAKIWPMVWGIEKSFTNYNGFNTGFEQYVGFDNYVRVFTDGEAMPALLRTFKLGLIIVPITLIMCNVMAILLTSLPKGLPIYRVIYYIPSILPLISATLMWQGILTTDGVMNAIIGLFGIEPINWLGYDYIVWSLVFLMVWGCGSGILTNIAAMKAIPTELYEAAEIDGAGYMQKLTKITLPLISNMNTMNLIVGVITTLQLFGEPVLLSGASLTGLPLEPIYTYMVHVYQQIFVNLRFGYGLALTWIVVIVITTATSIVQGINNKVTAERDY